MSAFPGYYLDPTGRIHATEMIDRCISFDFHELDCCDVMDAPDGCVECDEGTSYEDAYEAVEKLVQKEAETLGLAWHQSDDWEISAEEWRAWQTLRYLTIEEGLYLVSGINVGNAVRQFRCAEGVFFNIRPDFGRICLLTGLDERPVNFMEMRIRGALGLHYFLEVQAIKRAIDVGEIELPAPKTLDWWLNFWDMAGIAVSRGGETANKTESKSERQDRLRARLKEEKAKGNRAFLVTVAKEEGISVSRIKQLVGTSQEPAEPRGVWKGLLPTNKTASSKKSKA